MSPAIAKRNTAERQPRWPNRTEVAKELGENDRGRKLPAGREDRHSVEQAAGARRIVDREDFGSGGNKRTETLQQIGTAFDSDEWIGLGHLQTFSKVCNIDARQRIGVRSKRMIRIRREKATSEHRKACQTKTF